MLLSAVLELNISGKGLLLRILYRLLLPAPGITGKIVLIAAAAHKKTSAQQQQQQS